MMVVFAYAALSGKRRERMAEFCRAIGELARMEIVVLETRTYEELAASIHRREVDFAWLPPIPFIALERRDAVTGLATLHRDGRSDFHAVMIVHRTSTIQAVSDLQGARAAWVDPYSASGYVVPRIALDAVGVDLRAMFGAEKFYRSHERAVRAVVERRADFGATYAGLDASGALVRGPWAEVPNAEDAIRVLAIFSAIPADVIGARADLPLQVKAKLARAFLEIARDPSSQTLIRDLFGADEFRPWTSAGYDDLRSSTMHASERGLLEGREHGRM